MTTKKPNAAMTEENLEERYERYRSILKDLTIMSDVFMRNVLKQRACTEYVLQVIMDRKDLWVVDQVLQKDYKNLQGRSAILDCVVRDVDGNQFDVEIQQEYVNSANREDTELGRLMDDLNCKNAADMYNKILAKRVYELKETQEGVEIMCKEMDQIYREGETRGEMKKAFETAITLFEMGESVERIAQAVKVSTELVQEWLSGNGNLENLNV